MIVRNVELASLFAAYSNLACPRLRVVVFASRVRSRAFHALPVVFAPLVDMFRSYLSCTCQVVVRVVPMCMSYHSGHGQVQLMTFIPPSPSIYTTSFEISHVHITSLHRSGLSTVLPCCHILTHLYIVIALRGSLLQSFPHLYAYHLPHNSDRCFGWP